MKRKAARCCASRGRERVRGKRSRGKELAEQVREKSHRRFPFPENWRWLGSREGIASTFRRGKKRPEID